MPTIMTRDQGLSKVCDILDDVIDDLDRLSEALNKVRIKLEGLAAYLKDASSNRASTRPETRVTSTRRSQARPRQRLQARTETLQAPTEEDQCM
jgi:hypothetical protein